MFTIGYASAFPVKACEVNLCVVGSKFCFPLLEQIE